MTERPEQGTGRHPHKSSEEPRPHHDGKSEAYRSAGNHVAVPVKKLIQINVLLKRCRVDAVVDLVGGDTPARSDGVIKRGGVLATRFRRSMKRRRNVLEFVLPK
jgi:NADPH:quinone reductase-like Zn-dependent oxidoreductase